MLLLKNNPKTVLFKRTCYMYITNKKDNINIGSTVAESVNAHCLLNED